MQKGTRLIGIPHVSLDLQWETAKPLLQKALDLGYGELTIDDVYRLIKARTMQLWLVANKDGKIIIAATTEIINYPAYRVCRICLLGGKQMMENLDALDQLYTWARDNGCKRVEAMVREGMAKRLKERDYKKLYTVVGYDLNGVNINEDK